MCVCMCVWWGWAAGEIGIAHPGLHQWPLSAGELVCGILHSLPPRACPCPRDLCVGPSPRATWGSPGQCGLSRASSPPGFPSCYLSAAQESRGHVWIPEGMFSTFLETHCGLVFRGKGLGRGSAQWKAGGWVGPESRRHSLSAHCVPGTHRCFKQPWPSKNLIILLWIQTGNMRR